MPTRSPTERRRAAAPKSHRGSAGADSPLPAAPATFTVLVLCCLGLRIAAGFVPSNATWGLDAFGHLPLSWSIALAGLAVAGFLPAFARPLGVLLDRWGDAWHRRPRLFAAIAGAVIAAALFVWRDPLRFSGDADLRVGMLSTRIPAAQLFQQAFPLDLAVNAHLVRGLMTLGWGPEVALRAVGAAMGAVFAMIAVTFVREADARRGALPACALLVLGGGTLLAFPGYDKFGPLLVGVALATLGAQRLAAGRGGAWTLAAGTAIAVLSHRTGYLIVPAAGLAFAIAMRRAGGRAAVMRLALPAAVALAIAAAMLPRTLDLLLHYDLGVQHAAAAAPAVRGPAAGGLAVRALDALNLMFFLAPLWPVGVAGARRPGLGAPLPGLFMAVAMGLQIAVLLAVRSQQGAARDWDMNSGLGVTLGLATAYALAQAGQRFELRHFWPAITTVAVAIMVAQWSMIGSEGAQLHRIRTLLTSRPEWNPEQRARAFDFIGLNAFNAGRFAEAAQSFERAADIAPNPRYFYQAGLAQWRAGQADAARALMQETIKRNPAKGDPWWVLAAVAAAQGDSVQAAAAIDSARAHGVTRPPAGLE